ncbi:MAG: HAMP domain-containing histidine kinase [Pedosphaera sp.]|nr:HAMP domain-containing histidine kinase [Pedosphaera sp.]
MDLPRTSRWLPAFGILFTLLVLGAAVAVTQGRLRLELRDQLAEREGRLLAALLDRQLAASGNGRTNDPLQAVIETSIEPDLSGVLAVRLFDLEGHSLAQLLGNSEAVDPDARLLQGAGAGMLQTRFHPSFGSQPPRLEVVTPLRSGPDGGLFGLVQYILDGAELSREYSMLDARLLRQSAWVFSVAGIVMTGLLAWAFQRLARFNRLLVDRTARLLQANYELTLAAKTSAVGAVTSHLVHGLKNPLAALRQVIGLLPEEAGRADAADSTHRMQRLIDEVVRVLRDEQDGSTYELSLSETMELLTTRISAVSREKNVAVKVQKPGAGMLSNREANLVLLILENLATNAIQATPSGGTVRLWVQQTSGTIEFWVRDEGAGIPEAVRAKLFTSVISSKPGGSGLGLAISRQLALHLGATLDLEPSDNAGTTFVLRVARETPRKAM